MTRFIRRMAVLIALLPVLSCASQEAPSQEAPSQEAPREPCIYTATPDLLTITTNAEIERWIGAVWFVGEDLDDPDGASLTFNEGREAYPGPTWIYTSDDEEGLIPPVAKVTLMEEECIER